MSLGDLPLDFQADAKNADFEVLPKGRYKQQLTGIEVSHKDSGAVMLELEGEILSEPHVGRKIWTSINLIKKDGDANTIGNGQLSALAIACGKDSIPHDESTLLAIPHMVSLAVEPGTPEYPNARNKMTGFYPLESAGKQHIAQKVQQQAAAAEPDADLPF